MNKRILLIIIVVEYAGSRNTKYVLIASIIARSMRINTSVNEYCDVNKPYAIAIVKENSNDKYAQAFLL